MSSLNVRWHEDNVSLLVDGKKYVPAADYADKMQELVDKIMHIDAATSRTGNLALDLLQELKD